MAIIFDAMMGLFLSHKTDVWATSSGGPQEAFNASCHDTTRRAAASLCRAHLLCFYQRYEHQVDVSLYIPWISSHPLHYYSIYMFEFALMAFSPSTAQRIELKETQIMNLHWMQSEKWYVFAYYMFDIPL